MSNSTATITKILEKEVDARKLMYGLNIIQQPLVPDARYYINRFDKETGPPAFPNIRKADIKFSIQSWLNSPNYSIDQRNASLCGPAAFFFSILRQRRELYVKAVTELYLYGITKIGHLVIIPSDKTKNVTLNTAGGDISGADWVVLASLRDSENNTFRYDKPARQFAGITWPHEMADWFKQAGATGVTSDYNIVAPKDINNFAKANIYFKKGYSVCLFINIAMIVDQTFVAPSPNHWVLLNGEITSSGKLLTPSLAKSLDMRKTMAELSAGEEDPDFEYNLNFKIFTSGYKYFTVSRNMSYNEDIMKFYYGFVAAKW